MKSIIELAREARLAEPSHPFNPWGASDEALTRFAALVRAQALEEAAVVCEKHIDGTPEWNSAAINCADSIRALKEKT